MTKSNKFSFVYRKMMMTETRVERESGVNDVSFNFWFFLPVGGYVFGRILF